jgi:hypothetical protein
MIRKQQYDNAIVDKAIALCNKTYLPEDFAMFMRAIDAKCLDPHKFRIQDYMSKKDYSNLGLLIMNAIVIQLDSWAYEEAAGLYNSTLGGGDNQ